MGRVVLAGIVVGVVSACGGAGFGDDGQPVAGVRAGVADAGSGAGVALEPGDVWIRGVTLVSPDRDGPLREAHVVVRGERIVAAGGEEPVSAPDVRAIDGAGRYLVPGLIDGHVHLATVPGLTREHEQAMPAVAEAYYRLLPRSYLYFGFTAVVDLNVVDPATIDRLRRATPAPAVFHCGNGLAFADGYPMAWAPPETRFKLFPNFLYDSDHPERMPAGYAPDDHTPEAAVGRVADAGGVCVKAFYERGFGALAGRLPVPGPDLLRRVREASHRRGLPLLLHANALEAHQVAAEVGADAVVHGLWNWNRTLADRLLAWMPGHDGLSRDVRAALDAGHDRGVAYMPTSRVLGGLLDLFDPAFLDDPRLAQVLPAALIAWYRTDEGQWFKAETARDFGGLPDERIRAIGEGELAARRQRPTTYVARQGRRIVFGSDTPSAPTWANPPGFNGYLEMRELEAAGVLPAQILAAATIENARLFRLEDDYGTIAPGKMASLLLLREDPLVSTSAYDAIDLVIVRGQPLSRGSLAAEGAR